MTRLVIALALALALASPGLAEVRPHPGGEDPRIQSVAYDPDQVVVIEGALRNQIMLEFAPGERLENVAIGDSVGWQVTPNKRADLLFLKPLEEHAVTNMTVVTDERRYVFELRVAPSRKAGSTPYVVRFIYPPPAVAVPVEPAPDKPPEVVNTDYVVAGSGETRPIRIFDDGHKVYFQWAPDVGIPAIFAVSTQNGEGLVNYVVQGPYVVVEQRAAQFVLRSGKDVTTVTDRAFTQTEVAGAVR
jgi:type IV secretion system protein VirB9